MVKIFLPRNLKVNAKVLQGIQSNQSGELIEIENRGGNSIDLLGYHNDMK